MAAFVYAIENSSLDLDCRISYNVSMIDLQLIDKGQTYKKLNQSYIIFICPFDLYGKGRHIYTFENVCKEDAGICLEDGTTKIFLNAKGEMDDVSKELKAFLDYAMGKKSDDVYVKKLEEAVEEAKRSREWRHEYMTLLMRDQENLEKGMEKGIEKGKIYGAVLAFKELKVPEDMILKKLEEKFQLTEKEAKEYLQEAE